MIHPMDHRPLGSLSVTVVGLGCNNFGRRLDEARSIEVIHATLDAGINLLDTADIYGGTLSETYVGKALKGRRDQAIVATKFGMEVDPEKKGAKPAYIRQAVEDSLKRLDIDTIDLYQLHTPDESTPIADTLATLNDLVKEGKVREIGCSNFSVAQLQEAERAAKDGAKFVSVQNEYSLFHREPDHDGVLLECGRQGLGFLPYFPLASGLLSGKYRKGQPIPEGTRVAGSEGLQKGMTEAKMDAVEALLAYAEARGHSLLDLAFAWLLAEPTVSSVIAGATKPHQIRANAAAGSWRLTPAERAEVSQIVSQI
jgi:aryl-alcohol dehydrogenase-like predicted oxidoreductase